METVSVKTEARRLIERLPENVPWDDVMHEIYVRLRCVSTIMRHRVTGI